MVFSDETLTKDFLLGAALVLSGLVIAIMARDARARNGAPPDLNTLAD
nr:hypothetical protein [Cypionkella psychrotolerans]